MVMRALSARTSEGCVEEVGITIGELNVTARERRPGEVEVRVAISGPDGKARFVAMGAREARRLSDAIYSFAEHGEDVGDRHLRDLVHRLKSETVTDRERERGDGEVVRKMLDDELLARVRHAVEVEDAVRAYLEELDGPLADPSASLARLRAAVGR